MQLRIACALACVLTNLLYSTATAQLSENEVRQLGLETAWRSQVQLPATGRGLVSAHIWEERDRPHEYAVVELEDRTIRISAERLDRNGQEIGLEEAKKQAREQAARYLGKPDGFELKEITVPRLKLVLTTSDGLVQVMEAETGMLLWSTSCGSVRAPAFPAALADAGVVVIHGENLYLLDWETGKQLMIRHLRSMTSNAVAISGNFAFVSDFRGGVTTYSLGEEQRPYDHLIYGRAVGTPVGFRDQSFCAIASDRGYLYVFTAMEQPTVWIRYETSTEFTGSLAVGNNAFYAGSAGGVLAKITVADRLGTIVWEYRTGETITAPPLVVGQSVYVATEGGSVHAIEDAVGSADRLSMWRMDGLRIKQPLAVTDGMLICTSKADELVMLDAKTGQPRARTRAVPLAMPIRNQIDDRLYLVSVDGRVQCLRPVGGVLPKMVRSPVVLPAEGTKDGESGMTTEQPATSGPGVFEGFGAATTPTPGFDVDPFQGGMGGNAGGSGFENPFGGDATGGNATGGTANPFEDF